MAAEYSIPRAARKLFGIFEDTPYTIHIVGGTVRDMVMGRTHEDIDMSTSALPETTMEILRKAGLKPFPIGLEFGTVGAMVSDGESERKVEITTYRCSESYRKGSRHPEVAFGDSIEQDLSRRDFTINAMAMSSDGTIQDPTGGLTDLRMEVIRTPLDPDTTFSEDPLRMLRALRLKAELGFTLHPRVEEALSRCAPSIETVARERWKQEMDRILSVDDGDSVARCMQTMASTGLLAEILPGLEPMLRSWGESQGPHHYLDVWDHTLATIADLDGESSILRWAALFHDAGKPATMEAGTDGSVSFHGHQHESERAFLRAAEEMRFSNLEKTRIARLIRLHMRPMLYDRQWGTSAVRRLVRDAGGDFEILLRLCRADLSAHHPHRAGTGAELIDDLERRARESTVVRQERLLPSGLGSRIKNELGGHPGPRIGELMGMLEDAVADGHLPALAEPEVYMEYLDRKGLLDTGPGV